MPGSHQSSDDLDVYELLRQADELLQDRPRQTPPCPESDFDPDADDFGDADDSMIYRNAANHYGADGTPHPLPPDPGDRARQAASSVRAYNSDFRNLRPSRQKAPVSDETQVISRKALADFRQPEPAPEKKPPRKRRGCLISLLLTAVLAAALVFGIKAAFRPPVTDQPLGPRKSNTAAVLLCGADIGGLRTDTMMILFVDADAKQAGLLTLPRDTYTKTAYGLEVKLNSAYGRNDGGEEGMAVLLDYVQDIIGYRPDGYVLLELPVLEKLIDLMGGVDFHVPQDMTFDDQVLQVTLKEGLQHLDGHAAMGLLRFRYGYYNQDLGRQDVQKDFIKACLSQWLKPSKLGKMKEVLNIFQAETLTNLSASNFLWFGANLLRCGLTDISTDTLPGEAAMIGGQSFYLLQPDGVASLIQEKYNPYRIPITPDMLHIVTD